jgi:hypothetical protein
VRFNISDNVVNVIDNLRIYWMSCIVHVCDIDHTRFEYGHTSFIDSIDNLNSAVFLCKVENIVPLDEKAHFGIELLFLFLLRKAM